MPCSGPRTASSVPAETWPGMIGYGTPDRRPCHRCTSVPHTSERAVRSSAAPGGRSGPVEFADARSAAAERPSRRRGCGRSRRYVTLGRDAAADRRSRGPMHHQLIIRIVPRCAHRASLSPRSWSPLRRRIRRRADLFAAQTTAPVRHHQHRLARTRSRCISSSTRCRISSATRCRHRAVPGLRVPHARRSDPDRRARVQPARARDRASPSIRSD